VERSKDAKGGQEVAVARATSEQTSEPAGAPRPASEPEIPLEQCAEIAAEIGMKEAERAGVLKAKGLSEPAWAGVEGRWADAISEAVEGGDRTMLETFDAVYVATQERLGKRIGVPEYARILVGIERGEVGAVLAELKLNLSDLVRIQRVWSKRLTESVPLGIEVEKAIDVARGARAPGG
jgi:hypothetical protein